MYPYYDSYKDAIAYNNVGIQHMKIKDYNEANQCFQMALRSVKSIVEVEKPLSNNKSSVSSCTNSNKDDDNDTKYNDFLSSDAMIFMTTNTAPSSSTSSTSTENINNTDRITLFRPISIQLPLH